MAINKSCLVCGKAFKVKNSRENTAKYCSVKCKNISIRKTDEERTRTTIDLVCRNCNKPFKAEAWRKGKARYCSVKCANEGREIDKTAKCKECGKEFEKNKSNQRFCSTKCFGKYRQLPLQKCKTCNEDFQPYKSFLQYCSNACAGKAREGDNNPNAKGMETFTCEWCKSEYENYPSRKGRTRFCSEDCRRDWLKNTLRGENSHLWRGGTMDSRGENWQSQREKALKRDYYACVDCGMTNEESVETYEMSLSVHHLIPYRQFKDDYIKANKISNLVTVCVSCHHIREHELYKQYDNPEPSSLEMAKRCRD